MTVTRSAASLETWLSGYKEDRRVEPCFADYAF